MAGCAMFDALRCVGIELFADEPEVAERVTLLCARDSTVPSTSTNSPPA